jgi:hypothetical protein
VMGVSTGRERLADLFLGFASVVPFLMVVVMVVMANSDQCDGWSRTLGWVHGLDAPRRQLGGGNGR